ncbi:MAG TPA: alpha-amylase/4-alpha-glucanotransferase domain-containing protein, partial [Candidatus Eisenbacteria bacterium]
ELHARPRGLWLTERVWEPGLAASLARAGVAYTAVDDAHFIAAGLARDRLWGYYLTEDQGERLAARVDAGQVELWGGGFFEPVLAAVPEPDRLGQVRRMSEWLERELHARPRGLWLTERVWEPGLAGSLARAGVAYTAVDDAHFIAAGLPRDQLWGYFLTEDQGESLAVFPIHRELRYAVPFRPPEDVIALLRRVADGGAGRIAVLGDDGEKFGVWPGTHALCYEQGWLDRLAALLEANPWIEIRRPDEVIAHQAASGLVYLPTASYHELQEWALPPAAQARYERAAETLEPEFGAEARDLLRGGHWRGFLARYPEANRLHKRATRASRLLESGEARARDGWAAARDHLWRAQCNDVYWHGVFGGLYLPHLRAAAWRELIAAEAFVAAPGARIERGDLDLDGEEDALLETPAWAAWVGARGGALWALDDRARGWNCADTLARRPEAYHARLRSAALGGGEGETIHAVLRLKEPGLEALVERYDHRARALFLDAWTEDGRTHDWGLERFEFGRPEREAVRVGRPEGEAPAIEKRYARADDETLEVEYTLRSERARHGALEVELDLGLHVPRARDRYVELDGREDDPPHFGAEAGREGVRTTAFVDAWADRRLTIALDRPCDFRRAPIETVSLSEGGAERVFQGVEARYRLRFDLEPGRAARARFRVTLAAARSAADRSAAGARA